MSERHSQVPGWAVWSLRILVLLTALLILMQPVTAGLFVTGDVGFLDIHALGHVLLLFTIFLQLIAAVLVWRPGRGPAWPIGASVAFLLLLEMQAGFGFVRWLNLHVPGGVLMLGLAVAMLIGVWSPRLRDRPSRTAGTGADRPGDSPGDKRTAEVRA